MNALFFDGSRIRVTDRPMPRPGKNEALVRVRYAGICATDLEILNGYMAFRGIPGHEFVGIVEEAPEPSWVGRRVVGEINIGCGTCAYCLSGLERHCPNRKVLGILDKDGAFAEFLTLPLKNLYPVPDEISDHQAVFTEPLAAALEILEQVSIRPADRVAIVGDGKLAILVARVLANTGVKLTVVGKHPEKLARFQAPGVETVLLKRLSLEPQDVVVEASGKPDGWELAVSLLRPRGTLILKSTYHTNLTTNPAKLVIDEITVVGSRCGRFEPALRLLAAGKISVDDLITAEFPLTKGVQAFEKAREPGALKVLLRAAE